MKGITLRKFFEGVTFTYKNEQYTVLNGNKLFVAEQFLKKLSSTTNEQFLITDITQNGFTIKEFVFDLFVNQDAKVLFSECFAVKKQQLTLNQQPANESI